MFKKLELIYFIFKVNINIKDDFIENMTQKTRKPVYLFANCHCPD